MQLEATANYKCLFFLDVGRNALQPFKNSIQSHMVSYCSAIKPVSSYYPAKLGGVEGGVGDGGRVGLSSTW